MQNATAAVLLAVIAVVLLMQLRPLSESYSAKEKRQAQKAKYGVKQWQQIAANLGDPGNPANRAKTHYLFADTEKPNTRVYANRVTMWRDPKYSGSRRSFKAGKHSAGPYRSFFVPAHHVLKVTAGIYEGREFRGPYKGWFSFGPVTKFTVVSSYTGSWS